MSTKEAGKLNFVKKLLPGLGRAGSKAVKPVGGAMSKAPPPPPLPAAALRGMKPRVPRLPPPRPPVPRNVPALPPPPPPSAAGGLARSVSKPPPPPVPTRPPLYANKGPVTSHYSTTSGNVNPLGPRPQAPPSYTPSARNFNPYNIRPTPPPLPASPPPLPPMAGAGRGGLDPEMLRMMGLGGLVAGGTGVGASYFNQPDMPQQDPGMDMPPDAGGEEVPSWFDDWTDSVSTPPMSEHNVPYNPGAAQGMPPEGMFGPYDEPGEGLGF